MALSTTGYDSHARAGQRTWLFSLGVVLSLLLYAALQWTVLRADSIEDWRETDTQTIARHFTEPGANIFYPRIDWGGTGPGYVETEFQLYTWIVSVGLRLTGPSAEWPGQLVSLLAVLAAAWVTYTQLSRRYGQLAAALGVAALLASRGPLQYATRVQPEALCLLLFVIAWFALLDYTTSQSRKSLVLYAVAGATAMLVKPTAGQIGIASFVLLLLQFREILKKKEIWIAWALMVAPLVLHLLHARDLYLEYGNTFGILSGGESKVPRFGLLLSPHLLLSAIHYSVEWGVGLVGAAALVGVVFLKRRSLRDLAPIGALLVGVIFWTLLALKYTTIDGGYHYHILGALLGAEAVACAVATLPPVRWRLWVNGLLFLLLAVQLAQSCKTRLVTRQNPWDKPAVDVALAAKPHVPAGTLVIVRSVNDAYDEYWQTENCYQDPRVFYKTNTRGWPVAKDMDDPAQLERMVQQGARFYIEPEPREPMPLVDKWLDEHARLVATSSSQGRVFALEVQ